MKIVSWSGGKDSTATIILAHELGIKIDLIIISLIWFDKKRKIYAEYPEVIQWIFEYAIPLFNSWGYQVKVITSENDYITHFHHIVTRSKVEGRNGKKRGWLIGGACKMNPEKVEPIRRFIKELGNDVTQYLGIAADEKSRLESMHKKTNTISLLEDLNIEEEQTFAICEKYKLLSPHYEISTRGGCWFCPNQKIKEFAYLKQHHPELWGELKKLAEVKNKISEGFKYGKTFEEVEQEVDRYIWAKDSQITIFDLIKEE